MSDQQIVSPLPRCRVLVVDDNVDSADSLTAVVRMFGHDAETAYDGLTAVEKAIELVPDLILMDISLPKLSGYEAAARIRSSPACAHIVLVALTGWGGEEDKRDALQAGFTHHFIKPVDFPALKRLLAATSAAPT
jgi:CheY-like chemotaxis protein